MGTKGRQITARGPLPPSANVLYKKDRFGKHKLSDKAKAWKKHFHAEFMQNTDPATLTQFNEIGLLDRFEVSVTVHMNLVNKHYPEKAKEPLKRVDADNRGKFAQDTLCELLGLDDKLVFSSTQEKIHETEDEHVVITIRDTERWFGLPVTVLQGLVQRAIATCTRHFIGDDL